MPTDPTKPFKFPQLSLSQAAGVQHPTVLSGQVRLTAGRVPLLDSASGPPLCDMRRTPRTGAVCSGRRAGRGRTRAPRS